MNTNYKSIVLATSLFFALSASIFAAPGDLDPTFGNGGIVITRPGRGDLDYSYGMAIQSDGKIVVVGEGSLGSFNWDFAVVRYNPDGSLDSSFGGGIVVTQLTHNYDGAHAVAIQADGKIVVAGSRYDGLGGSSFAVVRYQPNGSLDTSFNGTGIVITSVGNSGDYAKAVAIQTDGRIVVAGSSGSNNALAIVRYNPNGSLDTSFGGTGGVSGPAGSYDTSVAIQADGKIIAGGGSTLVRYNPDGTLDTSFDASVGAGNSVAIQSDGKIVAAGGSSDGTNYDFAVVRLNPNGSLDSSFGGTGKILIRVGNFGSTARSVAIQTDGKIVAAGGASSNNTDTDFAVVRLNPNGSLDTTFNGTGKVITAITPGNDGVTGAAIQADGRIVVAGISEELSDFYTFVVVRYLSDAPSSSCSSANPIDCADIFVRQHYRDFLSREPDAPGQAHWTNEITMCSDSVNRFPGETEAQCIDRKRANTSGAFYLANEFQNSANFLIRVNWGSLGKDRAIGRKCIVGQHSALDAVCRPLYSDYVADMAKLTQGIVVNDQLDPNAVNTNKRNFVNEFVTRPDFLAAYPNTMTADAYVDKLSQTTGIALTVQERSDLINKVGTEGRAAVLFDMVDGTITIAGGQLVFNIRYGRGYYDQEFNPAFVFVQYLAYLRRNPDQAGYDHWLSKLNFYGNFVDAQMVRAFLVSDEYRTRFGMP